LDDLVGVRQERRAVASFRSITDGP